MKSALQSFQVRRHHDLAADDASLIDAALFGHARIILTTSSLASMNEKAPTGRPELKFRGFQQCSSSMSACCGASMAD
jgi:hypothetical protein